MIKKILRWSIWEKKEKNIVEEVHIFNCLNLPKMGGKSLQNQQPLTYCQHVDKKAYTLRSDYSGLPWRRLESMSDQKMMKGKACNSMKFKKTVIVLLWGPLSTALIKI